MDSIDELAREQNINESVLALIPARGGSKGLPGKNILKVNDRPLIAWTIEAALNSRSLSRVILSSDDNEIMRVAKSFGCEVPFKRPSLISGDTASAIDVVLHAVGEIPGYRYVMLLQPTSPLRTSGDIDRAFALLKSKKASCCVSVRKADESPYIMQAMDSTGRLTPVLSEKLLSLRRQDLPQVFVPNGAIYLADIEWLKKKRQFFADGCIGYEMPGGRSLDIDTGADFQSFCKIVGEGKAQGHI